MKKILADKNIAQPPPPPSPHKKYIWVQRLFGRLVVRSFVRSFKLMRSMKPGNSEEVIST